MYFESIYDELLNTEFDLECKMLDLQRLKESQAIDYHKYRAYIKGFSLKNIENNIMKPAGTDD